MPLRETSPQLPVVPYGRSKLAAEWLIQDYARAHGLGYTLLRYFNASGADSDGRNGECRKRETHLIPIIFEVATGRRPELTIYGHDLPTRDGTCVRDYIHIEDLAEAHRLAAEALHPGREAAYNMGSGTGTTVLEVLRACEQVVGRSIPHHLAQPRPGDPATLIASPDRISQELGWKPRYPHIADIVETAWRWHRSHPRGYVSVVANGRKLMGANLLLQPSF
jgi:UDP-glucose 4-epimerase